MTDVIQLPLPFQETAITGYVYTLTFPGGYTYVGSTTQEVRERVGGHIADIKAGNGCKNLITFADHYGFEKVRCEDTGRKRWQFKDCIVVSKKYTVPGRSVLRQHENRAIKRIDKHLRINERAAYMPPGDNDFTIPVSCQEWVDMLYPEQASIKKIA